MIWSNLDSVYFVGIGGIGMSALARYFVSQGKKVAGYDRVSSALTGELSMEGIDIHFEDRAVLIPEPFRNPERTLVIYTPAVSETNYELNYFRKRGFRVIKRAVALGEVFNAGRGIGIAGTHGKTTITTMLAHVLSGSTLGCNAFLGGISKNRNSNFYLDPASRIVLAEADEYDRSFLSLFPEVAVVSSMDADHLDIYHSHENLVKGFEKFISQIREKGKLILKYGLAPAVPDHLDVLTYSVDQQDADYHIRKLQPLDKGFSFSVVTPSSVISNIELGVYGRINVENALAAIAVANEFRIPPETIASGLATFSGVRRRFDVQVETGKRIYIDDYAHHPEEIRALLSSIREIFPQKRITGIFQPHLYSRTRDFAEEFARSLGMLDELFLMDIYPAREEPIEGITSDWLIGLVPLERKIKITRDNLFRRLRESNPELLLTIGAGDIENLVKPIRDWMKNLR